MFRVDGRDVFSFFPLSLVYIVCISCNRTGYGRGVSLFLSLAFRVYASPFSGSPTDLVDVRTLAGVFVILLDSVPT